MCRLEMSLELYMRLRSVMFLELDMRLRSDLYLRMRLGLYLELNMKYGKDYYHNCKSQCRQVKKLEKDSSSFRAH